MGAVDGRMLLVENLCFLRGFVNLHIFLQCCLAFHFWWQCQMRERVFRGLSVSPISLFPEPWLCDSYRTGTRNTMVTIAVILSCWSSRMSNRCRQISQCDCGQGPPHGNQLVSEEVQGVLFFPGVNKHHPHFKSIQLNVPGKDLRLSTPTHSA